MKQILLIDVNIKNIIEMDGESNTVKMIQFDGYCNSGIFCGKVLDGGVDTQIIEDGITRLSARYILEGVDYEGYNCKIFIENNGIASNTGKIKTVPRVITDSPYIKWIEKAICYGEVISNENGLKICLMG